MVDDVLPVLPVTRSFFCVALPRSRTRLWVDLQPPHRIPGNGESDLSHFERSHIPLHRLGHLLWMFQGLGVEVLPSARLLNVLPLVFACPCCVLVVRKSLGSQHSVVGFSTDKRCLYLLA